MARRGPTHPGWENPPRLETFPRLRSREEHRANQPLLFVAIGMALVMASLVLFPIIIPKGSGSAALPSSSASNGSGLNMSPSITPSPTPGGPSTSFTTYIVTKKDVAGLSGIAAKYNVSLPDLIAANPQIKNVNVIWEGMPVYIPPIGWHAPAGTPAATPTATPT
jgi:LysM repeat protein